MQLLALFADLTALVGGTVHSMVPGEEPRVATVLIRDGRIEAVAPDLSIPAGATRHDVSGRHVLPGLIDGLAHFDPDHDALYLAAGVTTVRDFGGVRAENLLERDAARRERTPGPNLLSAGALIDGDPPATSEAVIVRDARAAAAFLEILFEEDVDFLSIHLGLTPEAYGRILELAREEELAVWGPIPRDVPFASALSQGQSGLLYLDRLLPEAAGVGWHNVQPGAFDPSIELLAESGSALIPALQASALRLYNQWGVRDLLRLLSFSYENWWLGELSARLETHKEQDLTLGEKVLEKQRALLKRLHEAGVPLVPGSASPHPWLFPGQALHQEMAQWVQAGIEPGEVLRLATRGTAEVLGIADIAGSVRPGLQADLVCVDADPREGLDTLFTPHLVVIRGRTLERRDLADLLEGLAQRFAEEREVLATPMEVPPPPTPEGALVLEGIVETRAATQRLSSEHYRVVRAPDGQTVYCGRVQFPTLKDKPERWMTVQQFVRDGQIESFQIVMNNGEDELVVNGLWTAQRMRMERRFNGAFQDNQSSPQRPLCVNVGSVTALMILGQHEDTRPFSTLTFHEALEPEFANWSMELDDKGQHQVRTHTGRMAFRFTPQGSPELWHTKVGDGLLETALVPGSENTFGGPGHPLPASKRLKAQATEAAAETGGDGSPEGGSVRKDSQSEGPEED